MSTITGRKSCLKFCFKMPAPRNVIVDAFNAGLSISEAYDSQSHLRKQAKPPQSHSEGLQRSLGWRKWAGQEKAESGAQAPKN
ncbi:Hypothetical protein FKW44_002398 [Caligus rogercresseyi]|uniref:Uncharacterized protein n=1 Tax=Caligus rogercresseyi TaxID=217165 RepID=A0A7T8KK50_CALRO|nr:Hypothetical protein FKW44_002398 [Caligus rogercresseyi]